MRTFDYSSAFSRNIGWVTEAEQVQLKNVRLDLPEALQLHAQAVYQQVVVTQQMPMSNSTGITPEERALIGRWFELGAPVR